ncbi:S26 family signal peptidase [Halorubrum sp. GN11_10-6_MGM]|uniref:S26 family signal peptidase n=1 Tax=Halorubrum sp. GN11_10-6_MGM TaxID=2518112 RepID=UPI0010F608C6|nr:S26 family signal peptidase [Halorubrum sp. GN11_10-6_MGM]TKX76147.1 S26 family signal peptidase [Halorubrum sp. GN11_10-6_MGM]
MDEGDRPTETDESAGRDDTEDGSATAPDETDDRIPDETDDRIPNETDDRVPDEADDRIPNEPDERDLSDRGGDRSGSGPPESESEGDAGGEPESSRVSSTDGASRLDGDADWESRSASTDPSATGADESLLYRFRHDRDGVLMWIREMLSSVAVVLLVGLLLFGVSGVWPPMVAVESGSMEPNMRVGDLVFVTEPGRLAPDAAENGVGVVTHEVGQEVDYRTFGSYGSVMIYSPPDRAGSPIIHRAMFHVNEGENWYDRADAEYHNAVDCGSLANCPAPHDGYITLGDNNGAYDQASGLSPPVRAEWVNGVARARVPFLGYIRLIATGQVELNEAITRTIGATLPPVSASSFGANAAA